MGQAEMDFSLNIIAEPAVVPRKAQLKQPRTKYERRRQQKAARLLREKEIKNQRLKDDFPVNEKVREDATAEKSEITKQNNNTGSGRDEEIEITSTNPSTEEIREIEDDTSTEEEEEVEESDNNSVSPDIKNDNEIDDNQEWTGTLPEDEAARAAYLAEFHARPLELDRRAGAARSYSRSKESKHLFVKKQDWKDLHLHEKLLHAVQNSLKLQKPTVVQTRAIPSFTGDNALHNIFIQSETGSGKTLAFLLPILQSIVVDPANDQIRKRDRKEAGTQVVVLCPTRELAAQTMTMIESVLNACKWHWIVPGCLLGEERRKSEKARIRKGLTIIVATPGRFLDHLQRTESLLLTLKAKLQWLVLDEADRLLEMGLGDQVTQIIQRIRANQPGSGMHHDGITWRSVLVSATVTRQVEILAKESLLGGNNQWTSIKGTNHDDAQVITEVQTSTAATEENKELMDATPRQLKHLHVTVSAKLRLSTLVAFLVQRVQKKERTVVFLSTCNAVDYYYALFQAMDCVLAEGSKNDDKNTVNSKGMFGKSCSFYKLHGNIPHGERQLVLKRFMKQEAQSTDSSETKASVLLTTDVAARGLNLPEVDWIVQFDPPGEVSDYVHRAGRVARAGKAGHCLLFLLPSERKYLDVLKNRGVKVMSALSLTSVLNSAASVCKKLTREGIRRSGGAISSSQKDTSRSGEAFSCEIQYQLENCVIVDDSRARDAAKKQKKQNRKKGESGGTCGALLELAQKAFLSHIRAYPTKEKPVRHIFSAKALHLGHIARSFALKDPPKKVSGSKKRKGEALVQSNSTEPKSEKMRFDFQNTREETRSSKSQKRQRTANDSSAANKTKKAKTLLFANATKLQNMGVDGF